MFGIVSVEVVITGMITGLIYALLGAGLVLVYRATRVLNLAHAEMGAFAAAVLARLVVSYGWNFFLALPVALAAGALVGAVVELVIVRRLFAAPRLMLLIATVGAAQLLLAAQFLLAVPAGGFTRYPTPYRATVEIGQLVLHGEHLLVLAVVPPVVLGLTWFLTRSRYGIAIRASAANPDAAELAGISVRRVSTIVWIIAGVLAALTVILVNPVRGVAVGEPTQTLGAGLLLRVLCAAALGRFTSLPLTIVGGVAVGIGESIVLTNAANPGVADVIVFAALVAVVLLRGSEGDDNPDTGLGLATTVRPLPSDLAASPLFTGVRRFGLISAVGIGAAVPFVVSSNAQLTSLARVLLFGIIALSVTVLTGWAGQLSLGQFAFVGLGSMTTAALVARGLRFDVAVGYATVAGALAAVVVGFPALRTNGLHLAAATLGFAVAARNWLLDLDLFTAAGNASVPRSDFLGVDLVSQRSYYWLCLVVLAMAASMVVRVRRAGAGRALVAVRENEQRAASFGVAPATAKLAAFAVSGGLAALGGALLAGLRVNFGTGEFGPAESLAIVAIAVIGGLDTVTGALLGTLYVIGVPALFGSDSEVQLLTSGIGLLILVLYFPGGLARVVFVARDLLARRIVRTSGPRPRPEPSAKPLIRMPESGVVPDVAALAVGGADLEIEDLTVRFGGVVAVDGATITVGQGEVVGLMGSNGAGKSTLMGVASGFVLPADGTVRLFGTDVTGTPPHGRATLGLGRIFQDARLFPNLTVRETVLVALESRERSELVPAALSLPPARRSERAKRAEADEVIARVGLGRYANAFVRELSTGTRRIVELACLIAQRSRLLLLDEPTAGVAQREAEAFGPLIVRIAEELDASVLLIEHDLPLVLGVSDRVYCMSAGTVIAEGDPHTVASDPVVIAAYLGTADRSVQRSDTAVST